MPLTGLESSSQRRLRNHDVLKVTRARTRRIIRGGEEGDFINIHIEARLSHVRDECLVFTAIHLRRENQQPILSSQPLIEPRVSQLT